MDEDKKKVGRPPKYTNPEDFQKRIEEYFESGYRTKPVKVGNKKDGYEVKDIPMITLTDLVLFLGFADKSSFYDYGKKPEYSHSVKRASTFIEREYEEMLQCGNFAGAIFALKNFEWTDKQEIEHSGEVGFNPVIRDYFPGIQDTDTKEDKDV